MAKPCTLEFGADELHLQVPDNADVLRLPPDPLLVNPGHTIQRALHAPIGTVPLADLVRAKRRLKNPLRACIVVSDNTRPVPYQGDQGILEPVISLLRVQQVSEIEILVANGTHRALSEAELRRFLPESVFANRMRVTNHVCTDRSQLRLLGRTRRGTEVWINRHYMEADIKILTGLVEPHFMAGASGGAKSICPGLVGQEATHIFHGAEMMSNSRASSLVLDGNPCREESQNVASMAGADFIVNVTLNRDRQVTGVYAGDVTSAYHAAVERLKASAGIPVASPYDVVLTHAGFVGINHYQAAKSCVEAARAVRSGGSIIVAANHTDIDPVGSPNYRRVLPMLRELGVDGFERRIRQPDWRFVPDQWEVQMWGRVFRKLGRFDTLVYCSPQLTGDAFTEAGIPGDDGGAGLTGLAGRDLAEAMVQHVVDGTIAANPQARLAVLADGPYGVPIVRGA